MILQMHFEIMMLHTDGRTCLVICKKLEVYLKIYKIKVKPEIMLKKRMCSFFFNESEYICEKVLSEHPFCLPSSLRKTRTSRTCLKGCELPSKCVPKETKVRLRANAWL